MVQWFSGRLALVIFVCLQCGVFHITFFFLLQPCAVTYVEVFVAPVVGIVGLFLIIFADRVQVRPPLLAPRAATPPVDGGSPVATLVAFGARPLCPRHRATSCATSSCPA